MSGTSGDGVDASIVYSNGIDQYEVIKDKYFEYDSKIYKSFHSLKDKIFNSKDLIKLSKNLRDLERLITLFHAKVIKELVSQNDEILVGFHGQTIYHNPKEKVSKQLGDGKLLNHLTNKRIIYNFRNNDILNGGEGAPLTPLFHQLIIRQKKIKIPCCILNIGGISNISLVKQATNPFQILSKDVGPGNCLIDNWVRMNSERKFDEGGQLAASGKKNDIILEQAQDLYNNRKNKNKKSFDTNDFDISFSRGLSLEDGAATLTDFTARIIGESISLLLKDEKRVKDIIICGGGRKNITLLNFLNSYLHKKLNLKSIDDFEINGDFVRSQAFAFLAIRSYKKLPITFPNTTNCKKPSLGGVIIEN